MTRIIASAALTAALVASTLPALAMQFIQDNAQMFSASTVDQLNGRIANFNRDTGKQIVVVTVPSVPGGDVRTAAENTFAQQSINGVLIFVDKGDHKDYVVPDNAALQAGWWSAQASQSIVAAMGQQFRTGDFDGGITTGVNAVFDVYRSHLSSLRGNGSAPATRTYAQQAQSGGVHIGMFWWIIIALFAFFIIRSLIRASRGAYYGGGYGGPGSGPGPGYGPGYGGPGWGGGWGYGGGGGFWSGLLGGLGGAWLGNELFGGRNFGGMQGGVDPGMMQQGPTDTGGWQADPGQAGMSGGAGGDWGGGGWGDIGGGGGFGGGDGGAGGGW